MFYTYSIFYYSSYIIIEITLYLIQKELRSNNGIYLRCYKDLYQIPESTASSHILDTNFSGQLLKFAAVFALRRSPSQKLSPISESWTAIGIRKVTQPQQYSTMAYQYTRHSPNKSGTAGRFPKISNYTYLIDKVRHVLRWRSSS